MGIHTLILPSHAITVKDPSDDRAFSFQSLPKGSSTTRGRFIMVASGSSPELDSHSPFIRQYHLVEEVQVLALVLEEAPVSSPDFL